MDTLRLRPRELPWRAPRTTWRRRRNARWNRGSATCTSTWPIWPPPSASTPVSSDSRSPRSQLSRRAVHGDRRLPPPHRAQHVGWRGRAKPPQDALGLSWFELSIPRLHELREIAGRLQAAGIVAEDEGEACGRATPPATGSCSARARIGRPLSSRRALRLPWQEPKAVEQLDQGIELAGIEPLAQQTLRGGGVVRHAVLELRRSPVRQLGIGDSAVVLARNPACRPAPLARAGRASW